MKAKVIAKGRTVNGAPVAVGDIVEVDENTFRNLVAKGVLEQFDEKLAKPAPAPGKPA